jgi:phosphinothricin acetyltransferase
MEVLIRNFRREQWPRVRTIYAQGIASGHATFETGVPSWEQWDQGHLQECRLIAALDEEVVGWAALSPVSGRAVYRGVAEVSVYVESGARSMGIGTKLLLHLIEASEDAGIWMLQASLFPENEASLRLHLTCGFRIVGRRERIAKHHGVWRDTLLIERRSKH